MPLELTHTTTRDGLRLDGSFQPAGPDAVVCVHGTGSNFYGSTLFDALAERLVARNLSVLRINTRGHDLMSTAATARGGRRQGAAYEVVDDCRHDLAAWVGWLRDKGHARIILIGHSLGAVKCLYATAHEPALAPAAIVAISPPRLSHSYFAASERGRDFLMFYHQAEAILGEGEPDHLMEVGIPLPFVITAAGYAEKYGPDERYNYLRFLARVGCPCLVTLGELECRNNIAFRDTPDAVKAAGVRVEVIPGADHFYTGVRDELMTRIEEWLKREES